MPQSVFVHNGSSLPPSLAAVNQGNFPFVMHVLFPNSDAVLDKAQLSSFKSLHASSGMKPQLLLIVLEVPDSDSVASTDDDSSDSRISSLFYADAWNLLSVQLECKTMVLSQFVSPADYSELHAKVAFDLSAKMTILRDNAKQLSIYLQQKEMLWAQINASKRITTAKELVSFYSIASFY